MASTGPQDPEALDDETRWRSAGDRIQTLLDASAGSGTVVRERTEQLAAELTDLYGAALERMIAITAGSAPELVDQFAKDELVASLMLVHGLHPHGVERRIEDALDGVRPYLGSHGGDVALLEVVERQDGPVVRLQFAGSCKSCPSSAVTLEYAVEDAVRAAAPEIVSIEVVAAQPDSPESPSLISVDSVLSRLRDHNDRAGATWHPVPDIGDLGQGEIAGFLVAGVPILACRVADDVFAYHDRCGRCHESLAGAALHRPLGAAIGQAVLRCPRCHAHFDVVHAGVGVDDTAETAEHLDPIPLLRRDGVPSVSVIAEASGVM
ncbi:thioredoxin-like protein [Mycolicibacterium rhodesiae NBB3]|uniref:Thioredoxin-like protein n=1 Tax=Mycolicibacterium rhodesiae (strain NBB3) TaxID=710685 RepID=G8RKU8_MYCRN|nr:NifU family protein [Mycolicibacterium rhodesiae]AEV76075.1 thioredoxin-like protein [Mycolicibacterium rhodesiae NBB3]